MQHTHDYHTLTLRYVEHDVGAVFVTSQFWRDPVRSATTCWLLREDLEAVVQAVQVVPSLWQPEIQGGVLILKVLE